MAIYRRINSIFKSKDSKMVSHTVPSFDDLPGTKIIEAQIEGFDTVTNQDVILATNEINNVVLAQERSETPIGHLEDAGSSFFSAGKSLFNTLFSATKFAYHSVGAVGQLLFSGVSSFGKDASLVKASVEDGAQIIKEGAKTAFYAIDGALEIGAAITTASAPYVISAATYAAKQTYNLFTNGLDYINGSEDQIESHETEMALFVDHSDSLFSGDDSDLFDNDFQLPTLSNNIFEEVDSDLDF